MEGIPTSQNLSYGRGLVDLTVDFMASPYLVANCIEEVTPCEVYRVRPGPMAADRIVAANGRSPNPAT